MLQRQRAFGNRRKDLGRVVHFLLILRPISFKNVPKRTKFGGINFC